MKTPERPVLSLTEVLDDEPTRLAIMEDDPRSLPAVALAERAGFTVQAEPIWWDDRFMGAGWTVEAPPDLEHEIRGLVWDELPRAYSSGWTVPYIPLRYTLTRSTRHPGWQLTSYGRDGFPIGHADIFGAISEAFDSGPMASGQSVTGLSQVVFRDGRVLTREGVEPVTFNPDARPSAVGALKRSLLR